MALSQEQRRANTKKLMTAIKPTGLDFHTLQLATIDMAQASLLYFYRALTEKEKQAMDARVNEVSAEIATLLNERTQSPGEGMLILMDLLQQVVGYSMDTRKSG